MKRFLYINIILIIFLIVSCAHNAVSISEEPIIEEKIKVYHLISMHPAMNITISIDDNKIYGKSAINDYWANCKIEGEGISIDMIKTTRKTDNAEKRRVEGDYLSILQTAYSIKIDGNKLIIYTRFIDEPLIYEEIEY
ncbi:META domain-containing protein [Brachyspira hyodysenteriae]|uniref:META domain-containing protein n=1 Tax=Brachyspira hyodysenteriae TaxID=159 RepID=UPI001569603D|nr:META domain-containing protein [Brachyspira hyodysenteriae]MCZ9887509.1 META domain-containing protein [Brachyspira hyodysenteriae]MCZ9957065.1 META domain-containing protein [Brachyspira hyodysenteriae]MCZ9962493.1 META domain-containing protein [Brachyspira hyodysenteriae]MDA0081586.1 META domain-containing protein [Brachyspira hyodysenteriae]